MSWISQIKSILTRRKFKQANSKQAGKVKHEFVDIDQARRVGFIVNAQQVVNADLNRLKKYIGTLKQTGKEVYLVEINFQKKSTPAFNNLSDGIFINPEKLNWLDLPNASVEQEFLGKELDILMNFDNSKRATAQYLCTLANARTRTGIHIEGQEACYELMLDVPQSEEKVPALLDQFDFYLKMLEK